MDRTAILAFDFSLQDECIYVRIAHNDLLKQIAARDLDRTWYSLKALLRSMANISKILWPGPDYEARGEQLRSRLSVSDDSPLKSRRMRDRFEHADEYSDDSLKKHPGYQRGGINWGYRTMLPLSNQLGFLDCPSMTVVFLDETLDILSIIRAVEELSAKVDCDIEALTSRSSAHQLVEDARK